MLDDIARCHGMAINESGTIEHCALRQHCARHMTAFRSYLGSYLLPDLHMVRGFCTELVPLENENGLE